MQKELFALGSRYNVVAAISTEGIVAIRIFEAGVRVSAD